jgi:hypothetical protein
LSEQPGRRSGGPDQSAPVTPRVNVRGAIGAIRRAARWSLALSVLLAFTAEAQPVRLVLSVRARTLWVLAGTDTLRTVTVAVASERVLRYGTRTWRFVMPLGMHTVLGKRVDPVWTPPDWHYIEEATLHHWRVRPLPANGVRLRDGRRLVLRDALVGLLTAGDTTFSPLPEDEHIVFDKVLYIPPLGSRNRRLSGELGRFALDLGDGYLLHGTRDAESIGTAATHGCVRMKADDLEWVFEHVPVGTRLLVR